MNTKTISLTLLTVVLLALSCGTVASLLVTDDDEVKMGQKFTNEIEADSANFPLYTSKPGYKPALVSYINEIGQKIASAQADRSTLAFQFKIIDADTVINAFAVPGGFIYIYTGLIKAARNEDEIAGVIAHEVGHVTKRHGVNQMVKAQGVSWVLDMVVGSESGLRTVLDIASGFLFLKYSRENEFQADSCAVAYAQKAGYNPNGMKTFLDLLAAEGGRNKWGVLSTVLSTHPPSDERSKAVDGQITKDYPSVTATSPALTPKRVDP